MSFFLSRSVENIILITALINIVLVLAVFLSCRFIPVIKLTKPLAKQGWFKRLYKYHSYLWWLLMPSVLIHAIVAILHRLSGG